MNFCGLVTDHAFLKKSFYLKKPIWLDPFTTSCHFDRWTENIVGLSEHPFRKKKFIFRFVISENFLISHLGDAWKPRQLISTKILNLYVLLGIFLYAAMEARIRMMSAGY